MKILLRSTCLVLVLQILVSLSSCSFFESAFFVSDTKENDIIEYIGADTSVCFLPKIKIIDNSWTNHLDSLLSLYSYCEHCKFNKTYPNYFTIYGLASSNKQSLIFTNSSYTEELKTKKNEIMGGFYYADNLFVVHKSVDSLKNQRFEVTNRNIKINKCSLVILGVCFKATLTFEKKKYEIDYDCEEVLIRK